MKTITRNRGIYDLQDPEDLEILNHFLNPGGIHFEKNLFGSVYVILDDGFRLSGRLFHSSGKKSSRKKCINRESRDRSS